MGGGYTIPAGQLRSVGRYPYDGDRELQSWNAERRPRRAKKSALVWQGLRRRVKDSSLRNPGPRSTRDRRDLPELPESALRLTVALLAKARASELLATLRPSTVPWKRSRVSTRKRHGSWSRDATGVGEADLSAGSGTRRDCGSTRRCRDRPTPASRSSPPVRSRAGGADLRSAGLTG